MQNISMLTCNTETKFLKKPLIFYVRSQQFQEYIYKFGKGAIFFRLN